MQYYVIGPDGNKYGPADVPTLKQWVAENRLGAQSMLEDFNTGQRMPASQVPGLFDTAQAATAAEPTTGAPTMGPAGATYSQPTPTQGTVYAPYGRQPVAADDGKVFIILAWIFGALGLVVCCPYLAQLSALLGVVFSFVAGSKGNPGAKAVKIFTIIVLIISIVALVLLFAFGQSLQEWARQQQRMQTAP